MPYRAEPPLRTYPVKSSNTGVVLAAVIGTMAFGYAALAFGRSGLVGIGIMVACFVTTLAIVSRVRYDKIAGGAGEVRLFRSHVEVPQAYDGTPLELPIDELSVLVQTFETRLYFFATVSSLQVLTLRAGGHERKLSSRVFESPEDLQRLALDLASLRDGFPLPTHDDPIRNPDAPDEYDDRLEAELDALDD